MWVVLALHVAPSSTRCLTKHYILIPPHPNKFLGSASCFSPWPRSMHTAQDPPLLSYPALPFALKKTSLYSVRIVSH